MSIRELQDLLGPQGIVAPSDYAPYMTEWRDQVDGQALLVARPAATAELAKLVKLCARFDYHVVAQGGNTGLVGGAIPMDAERSVLVSLTRMRRVLDVNSDDNSLLVEAGCPLADVQAAAAAAGRYFPLSLAAEGTATIGGNLATNAGGINVLRYGTARDQVLGLEVVLADGSIWNGLRALRKNTAGYDLRQLFVGSEGTLGIITRALLRLRPQLTERVTAFVGVASIDAALALLHDLGAAVPDTVEAFELISARALDLAVAAVEGSRHPVDTSSPYYVLTEFAAGPSSRLSAAVEKALVASLERGGVSDVAMATSLAQREAFWALRHGISAAQKRVGASLKHDIALPLSQLGAFHKACEAELVRLCPGIRPVIFGHVGDGNLHYNLTRPEGMSDPAFRDRAKDISGCVYQLVDAHGGSVSAEHGIGQFKRDLLRTSVAPAEYALMRTLKGALDPANRLNPGKVLWSEDE